MENRKIALLVDSGTDVPQDFIKEHHIFVAPLKIIYQNGEFNDRLDITPKEIYDRLEEEIPRTSLPDSELVNGLFDQMVKEGYDTVLMVTISSGLSGTHNLLSLLCEHHGKLNYRLVDTKNIGIGAGVQAMLAAKMLAQGEDLDHIVATLEENIDKTKIYFCLDTLEYLAKGGRIGRVSALLGSVLRLRPIITCNAEGVYETVAKVRGGVAAIAKAINLTVQDAGKYTRYLVAVAHGSAKEEARRVMTELKSRLPHAEQFISSDISPALSVHTGPGLIGLVVQNLPV